MLGKVKNFSKLSIEELTGYCGLVKDEDGIQTAEDAAEALTARFGWPTTTRMLDIEAAWMSLNKNAKKLDANDISETVAKEIPSKILSKTVGENTAAGKMSEATKSSSSIPIVIKSNSWGRKVLICEILDDEFSILGDSGAVGRISVDPSSLLIDVKGNSASIPGKAIFFYFTQSIMTIAMIEIVLQILLHRTSIQRQALQRANSHASKSGSTCRTLDQLWHIPANSKGRSHNQ